ncbi:MAG: FAD-dependent oxidoreductase [Gammaproteobacteria bacterium]|nr:FAD-dependent oxidoreductase [Gammaproteobacteria bacterium]MYH33493.1 FAD-dependent oxidoreductase [Gammaproteobacteria bacterium]MYL01733.1 FAD-dependent oxidoreductase [Gammaproteobacteria bacterium]
MVLDKRPQQKLACDVLVVGGGAAGVAAAVTSAHRGLRVTLVERYGFCGGGAVAGMSGTICGIYEASDDKERPPRQVVHGFLDEFTAAMEARGGLTGPVRYGKTFTRVHDPLVWREVADHLLQDAGVRVLYHTIATDVLVEANDRLAGIVAYTKEGKISITARLTVDASGDADIVAMAGHEFRLGRDGQVQNPTMIFRLQGVDIGKLRSEYGTDSIMPLHISQKINELYTRGEYYLPRAKIFLFETPRPGELLCNATRLIGSDGRELNAVVALDLTEAEFDGRRQVREYARFLKDYIAGCENSWVNDTGVQVGVRQTRQLVGTEVLRNSDVESARKRSDGVARSPWPIELHKGDKPKLVWIIEDHYDVPLNCFVPPGGESLLVAGRCLSAEHEAMASARVTAQCFSYGHAVGHAAAIVVTEDRSTHDLPVQLVRRKLKSDGARL